MLIQILDVYSFYRGKKYGETANECGEAFFFYGKSLLELARYVFQAAFVSRMFCSMFLSKCKKSKQISFL